MGSASHTPEAESVWMLAAGGAFGVDCGSGET